MAARHHPGDDLPDASIPRPPSDAEFQLFQRLIHREAGIFLNPSKRELLVARLRRRLRALHLRSFWCYYRQVKRDPEERVRMLEAICTHETHFFREPRQFELLEERIFPGWHAIAGQRRRRSIRVWSAGCSTGEEPYSLAMTLLDHFPGWSVEVLATDLSNQILERARAAVWPIARADEIPLRRRKRYMLRGTRGQQGKMKAGPEIRAVVRFERLNLNDREYAVGGPFDLILCRNVLIYFSAESRARVIRRLLQHLAPDGALLLGHAESLHDPGTGLRGVGANAYVKADPKTSIRPTRDRRVTAARSLG